MIVILKKVVAGHIRYYKLSAKRSPKSLMIVILKKVVAGHIRYYKLSAKRSAEYLGQVPKER